MATSQEKKPSDPKLMLPPEPAIMGYVGGVLVSFLLPAFSHEPFAKGYLPSIYLLPTPGSVGVGWFTLLCVLYPIPPALVAMSLHVGLNRLLPDRFHVYSGFLFFFISLAISVLAALSFGGG